MKQLIAAALLSILLLLIGCGGPGNERSPQLIYWSSNNSPEIQFARDIVEEWNAGHPDWPIHTQPVPEGQSSEEVLLAAVVGNTTPDIYSNIWQGDVETYAQGRKLIALDTLPGFMDFLYRRCDSAVVAEVTSIDGHVYQIPWKVNPIMMMYNRAQLEEIGHLPAPGTYSEFISAGKRFQKDADGDGYIDRWIGYRNVEATWWQRFFDFYALYLAASDGAPLIKDNQVAFDNEYAVQVFAFLQTLYEQKLFPRDRLDARGDAFLSGEIATRFTGPWDISRAEKFKPEGFEYDFGPLPVPDGHTGPVYTYGDPKNIVIFSSCKNPRMAWEFLKTLISKENDLRLLQITSQLPRRADLTVDEDFNDYFRAHPKMVPFARQAKYVRGTDPCPVLKEVFDIISSEYEAAVIYSIKSPEEAIRDAAQAVRLIL